MNRIMICIFISLIFTSAAFSQEPEVREVYVQEQQVVLFDTAAGEEYTAKQGDEIGDNKIITEITPEQVTILKTQKNQHALVQKIPVGKKDNVIKIFPKKAK